MPAKKTSKYFMVGSTFMMVRNSPTFNVKLGFGDARGGYQPLHHSHQRSNPLLRFCEPVPTPDWIRDTAVPAFKALLCTGFMICIRWTLFRILPLGKDNFKKTF
jgi:hypothetical protein